jgi:hypothetical protein
MSHVTNYLVLPTITNDNVGAELNDLLRAQPYFKKGIQFIEVGVYAGGCKLMETDVWAAAVNYYPTPAMVKELLGFITVEDPQEPTLFLYKDQHEEDWTVVEIKHPG